MSAADGLGPLPEPHLRETFATAKNTGSVRHGYEQGGYLKWPDMFTAEQMRAYAAQQVAAERERLLSALRQMHDEQAGRAVWHNYFLFAANVLAGKILPEGEAPSTTRLVTLDQAEAMVAAERERIRLLVEAVRDANAASQDADDCLIYTPAVERAWVALLVGLDGPTAPGPTENV